MSQTYDLIVRGGLVVDGTGTAPMPADVAVRDERLTGDAVAVDDVEDARR